MKFKRQILIIALVGFLLGGASSFAAGQPSWMKEIPEVVCIKNQVWLVWVQAQYNIRVTGIFCSLTGDLV